MPAQENNWTLDDIDLDLSDFDLDTSDGKLALRFLPSGRHGVGILTAELHGKTVMVEKIDVTRARARQNLVGQLCNRFPFLERESVEAELLQYAVEAVDDLAGEPALPDEEAGIREIDASAIARPERFDTPEVSGVLIPTAVTFGSIIRGYWQLYLRWKDGRRECRSLAPNIDLPGGGQLWFSPLPEPPAPTAKPGWSAEARQRWLDGEAAPQPVELFKAMAAAVAEFIDLPRSIAPGATATVVCWAMLTYVFRSWPAAPYLFIGGPLGSGKSRLLDILSRMVFRPVMASSMTGPALFRTLDSQGGCLLLDEAETLRNANDPVNAELLSMLLAGYRRGGQAIRLEPMGDGGFRTMSFDVYCPKALACIAGLPPVLASRCIPIRMFRAAPDSEKPRLRLDAAPERWQEIRDGLHAMTLENGRIWLELPGRSDVCPQMSGRDYELWQPILSLASWLEEQGLDGLLRLLQEHALAIIDLTHEDSVPDCDETLLRLLAEELRAGAAPTPGELLEKARSVDPVSFKVWTPRAVSEHLKRYSLATHKRQGRKVYGRNVLEGLRAVEESYGLDLGFGEKEEDEHG